MHLRMEKKLKNIEHFKKRHLYLNKFKQQQMTLLTYSTRLISLVLLALH